MYININDLHSWLSANYNQRDKFYITDYIPFAVDNGVNIAQLDGSKSRYSVFSDVRFTTPSNFQISPLNFGDYSASIKEWVGNVVGPTFNINYAASSPEIYYKSYVEFSRDQRVSGVVDIYAVPTVPSDIGTFTWVPVGGATTPIDILTYISIFRKVFSNACFSYLAMKDMYNKYLNVIQSNGVSVNMPVANGVLASGNSISDVVGNMNNIITNTLRRQDGRPLTSQDLQSVIVSNGRSGVDMTQYYQYMITNYGLDTNMSIEMLKYAGDIASMKDMQAGAPDIMLVAPVIIQAPNVDIGVDSTTNII